MDDLITTGRGFSKSFLHTVVFDESKWNETEKKAPATINKPQDRLNSLQKSTTGAATIPVDLENAEWIFSQFQTLETNNLFEKAQKAPDSEKVAMLLA